MSEAEIYAGLTDIFRETFDDPALTVGAATSAADVPGWDSLKMVIIVMAVEERFGVRLRTREMDTLRCVGDFVALIRSKQAA